MQYLEDGSQGKVAATSAYPDTPEGNQRRWCAELAESKKELQHWHNQGDKVIARYRDKRDAVDAVDRKFNLFATNVDIMKSALYGRTPQPEVRRKFDDPNDDIGRVAALLIERAISQDLEDPPYSFGCAMGMAVQDWLVPGMGTVWLRLHVETTTQNDPTLQADYEVVSEEEVVIEHVHWKDLFWSPCRTWGERRWTARRVWMFKEECKKRFPDKYQDISYKRTASMNADPNDPANELFMKAEIFEIWDRVKKKVWWINQGMMEPLDVRDDPLHLTTFEPMPEPLWALQTTSNVVPVPDYVMIQDQYQEMDIVNNRISLLVQACKVVGVYDRANVGVQRLMTEGFDNALIPVDNWAMFAERGGLKGVVDWLPLEQVVQAIQQLNLAREAIKQQIYELTGISDIVRGATRASETLGAQELKAKFASVRIQTRQQAVARFASQILQIKAEMMLKHMQMDTILQRAGISYLQEPPQLVEQAVSMIRDHKEFEWRVSIMSDSLAQIDYAQERQDRMEFVNGVGNFLANSLPVLQAAPDMLPIMVGMIKFSAAGFSVSKEVEGILDGTFDMMLNEYKQRKTNPPPPPPDPAMVKAQADVKAIQMKTQAAIEQGNAKTQASIAQSQAKLNAQIQGDRMKLAHEGQMQEQQQRHDEQQHVMNIRGQALQQAMGVQGQEHDQRMAEQAQHHQQGLSEEAQDHAQGLAERKQAGDAKLARAKAAMEGGELPGEPTNEANEDPRIDALLKAVTAMAQSVAQLTQTLSAPKRAVRDQMGRVIGMEIDNGRVRS